MFNKLNDYTDKEFKGKFENIPEDELNEKSESVNYLLDKSNKN